MCGKFEYPLYLTVSCMKEVLTLFLHFGTATPLGFGYIVFVGGSANVHHKYKAVTCQIAPKGEKRNMTLNDLEL